MVVGSKRAYYGFVAPGSLILLLLTVAPIVLLFWLSVTGYSPLRAGSFEFIGLDNFRRILSTARAMNSIRVGIYYIVVTVFIQVSLGFVVAYLLYTLGVGRRVLRGAFILPMLLPPVVVGLMWRVLFTPGLGGINYFLSLAGIHGPSWLSVPTFALAAVTISAVWEWTPFVMIVMLAGLESLPIDPIESARIDGATNFQVLRFILLPLLRPIFGIVVILRVIEALGILPLIFVMTGGGPNHATEPVNLYAYVVGFNYLDIAYAASLLVVFIFILLILSLIVLKFTFRRDA